MEFKTLILFLLSLGVIVTIHELGHLLAAKLFNVYCHEFAIGMGPKIYSKKIGETIYSLRLIPLGGYVLMAGEPNDQDQIPDDLPEKRRINKIHPLKRIVVLSAGVFMNLVLFLVLMSSVFLRQGINTNQASLKLSYITENSVAQKEGLQVDDILVKVIQNDQQFILNEYDDLQQVDFKNTFELFVLREGKEFSYSITPEYDAKTDRYLMGVSFAPIMKKANLVTAIGASFEFLVTLSSQIGAALANLLIGKGLDQLSGPVGIYMATQQVSQLGLNAILSFIAMLSLNVGIFNLLPIPALDGGRILLTLPELFLGKPLNKKIEEKLIMGSFFLLLALIFIIIFKDIITLF